MEIEEPQISNDFSFSHHREIAIDFFIEKKKKEPKLFSILLLVQTNVSKHHEICIFNNFQTRLRNVIELLIKKKQKSQEK